MKKKVLIGIAVVIVLILGVVAYLGIRDNQKSPPRIASISNGELNVTVDYCAPYKKGRVIFGAEAQGALQPFGKYWRLGANAATQISFNKDVLFAGQAVPAGTYRMYAVPGAEAWQVALNSELGKWGADEPDHSLDVAKATVPAGSSPEKEQFEVTLAPDSTGVSLQLNWDKTLVKIPITPH